MSRRPATEVLNPAHRRHLADRTYRRGSIIASDAEGFQQPDRRGAQRHGLFFIEILSTRKKSVAALHDCKWVNRSVDLIIDKLPCQYIHDQRSLFRSKIISTPGEGDARSIESKTQLPRW